jgi:two-component system, sensor histidine kinase and response regulator
VKNRTRINPEDPARLRQKAEKQLKLQKSDKNTIAAEADMLKLIHELQVHQIELELQNEELQAAKVKAELAEEKYTSLYDFSTSGLLSLSAEGKIFGLNFEAAKMLGKERNRLINCLLMTFISEETRPVFLRFFNRVCVGKTTESCEVTLSIDGKPPIVAILDGVLCQKSTLCLLTMINITQRKQSEIALRESEQRYALVVDASEQGIWDWNIETDEVFYSAQWKKQIGYDDHEIKNAFSSWIEHLHPEEKERCLHAVQNYLDDPVELFFLEFRFRHKDGSYRWIHNKASSVKNLSGRVVRMFGSHTDITGRKEAELQIESTNEALSKLNAQKDKFFSIIAHDLRSPFNSILGFSQLLKEKVENNDYEGIGKYAEIISQSSQRTMDLLMNLLEWSRSRTGKLEFNPEHFELVDVVHEIVALFDEIARQKSISIVKVVPHSFPIFADKPMINTILRNLVSNAIKFTQPGGLVTVSANRVNQDIAISVNDNGLGIAAERVSRLFRIDESYSTPGTGNEKGTGLGLILCKEFVEKHGGRIWVESEEGMGSTFIINLPIT